MSPRHKTLAWLTLGMALGVDIWVVSPWLTGKTEPWDAAVPIWPLSWLVIAVAGAIAGHVRGVCLPLGYALGQMLVTINSVWASPFGALRWRFIGSYGVAATGLTLILIGTIALVKRRWRRGA